MGTRNLTCVVLDGEYRIAQYCQWDGYPDGQGTAVLDFLKNRMDINRFKEALKETKWITDEEHTKLWEGFGADGSGFVSMDISAAFKEKHPQLDRDMGAKVLDFVQEQADPVVLNNSIDFATDGLFCEWVYVIDLDKGVLEVYSGFGQEAQPEGSRFGSEVAENGYAAVGLVKIFDLDNLPDEERFIKELSENPGTVSEDDASYVAHLMREKAGDLFDTDENVDIANKMLNYIEANMDDFLEAVNAND